MNVNKLKEKMSLHPIMTIIIMIGMVIVLSGILAMLGVQATSKKISTTSLEYNTYMAEISSLFSLSGLKYIFTSTVNNFVAFAPLSSLLIVFIGIGVMQKSGFLKVAITLLTKNAKKNTVTFVLVLVSLLIGVIGDLSYIILLPIAGSLFEYGKRNPHLGIIASFAGLSCGHGINIILTSVDSTLMSLSTLATQIIDSNYVIKTTSFILVMFVTVIILAFLITYLTEKHVIYKLDKYEIPEVEVEEEFFLGKKEKRGLALSLIAFLMYFLIVLYNIIPGLPLSGKLLDNSQLLYIDKLFSYKSFFNTGFVFIVTMGFVILGFFYGIGARTIKHNKDFCENLGHSLDGIGQTLVLIFFASILINVVKYVNIGKVIITALASVVGNTTFTGVPLIILLFVVSAIATIFYPSSVVKWEILSSVAVPVFMQAGMSPEFAQVIFRFGESVTIGLTPLFAYFVIYLALLEKYNQKTSPVHLLKAIRYQVPYSLLTMVVFLTILIMWYIVGLPIGIGVFPSL